jgi:nitrate/nitrite-specific signal transduction histidine kinase
MTKFEEVLKIKKKKGNKISIAKSEMGIGILAHEMHNYMKSIKHLNNSNNIYEELNKPYELISINLYLAKSYKKINLKDKAYNALNKSYLIRDSLFYEEGIKEVEEIDIKYQTQQKENEILKLTTETQQKELDLQKSKIKTNYALASVFLVILGGGFYLRKRKKDQQLRLLEESIKSAEQEKNRIGRELHDSVASNLRKLAHDTKNKDITLSHKLLNSYESLRDLSHQLNNTPTHGELFMDSVFELMPKNNENQKFELKIEPPYLELREPYSTHLYRIIQELLTNNLKHASASKTSIDVILNDNLLILNYTDNGLGQPNLKKGTGIKSIEDRTTLLKGTIKINSENGFSVNIKTPYNS